MADDFLTQRINQILFDKIVSLGQVPVVSDLFRDDAYPKLFAQLLDVQDGGSFKFSGPSNVIANTAVETAFGPAGAQYIIPGLSLQAGSRGRFRAWGFAACVATPDITLRIRLGGVAGVILAASRAMTMFLNSVTAAWYIEGGFIVTAGGVGGALLPENARAEIANAASGDADPTLSISDDGLAAVLADLTLPQTLVATAEFSAANAGNTAVMHGLEVDVG